MCKKSLNYFFEESREFYQISSQIIIDYNLMLISKLFSSFKGYRFNFQKQKMFSKKNLSKNYQSQQTNSPLQVPSQVQAEKDDEYQIKINSATDIRSLIDLQNYIFNEKRSYLSTYLFKISNLINLQSYEKYKPFLNQVYYKTRKTSSELNLTTQQLLKVLMFSENMKKYQGQVNKIRGFQIRMSYLVAQVLLSKKLTLTQAITLYCLVDNLGHKSLQVVQNLAIFMKAELKNEKSIKIQQFLAVLRIYSNRRHKSVMQNVLADETIASMKEQSISLCENSTILIQTLRLISSIPTWRFYKTDSEKIQRISQACIKKILEPAQKEPSSFKQLKTNQVAVVLQSLSRLASLFSNDQELISSSEKLRKLLFTHLVTSFKQKNCTQLQKLLFSIAFGKSLTKQVKEYYKIWPNFMQNSKKYLWEQLKEENQMNALIGKLKRNQDNLLLIDLQYYDKILRLSNQIKLSLTHFLISRIKQNNKLQYLTFLYEQITNANSHQQEQIGQSIKLLYLASTLLKDMSVTISGQLNKLITNLIQKCKLGQKKVQSIIQILLQSSKQLNNVETLLYVVQSQPIIWSLIQNNIIKEFTNKSFEIKYLQFLFILSCSQVHHIAYKSSSLMLNLPFNQATFNEFLNDLNPNCQIAIHSQPERSSIFHKRFLIASKKLLEFSKKDQFCYHVWEIIVSYYLIQPRQTKLLAFDSLKESFRKALEKQTARKVVLLTYFTNIMAERLIEGSRDQLKSFFEQMLAITLNSEKSFHYHCYLQIVKNTMISDHLSLESFESILRIGKEKSKVELSSNCLLMLLFGMYLSKNNYKSTLMSEEALRKQLGFTINKSFLRKLEAVPKTGIDAEEELFVPEETFKSNDIKSNLK